MENRYEKQRDFEITLTLFDFIARINRKKQTISRYSSIDFNFHKLWHTHKNNNIHIPLIHSVNKLTLIVHADVFHLNIFQWLVCVYDILEGKNRSMCQYACFSHVEWLYIFNAILLHAFEYKMVRSAERTLRFRWTNGICLFYHLKLLKVERNRIFRMR